MQNQFGKYFYDRQYQNGKRGAFHQASVRDEYVHNTGNGGREKNPRNVAGEKIDDERHVRTYHLAFDTDGKNGPYDGNENKRP
jgi:hypothetical protein